MAVDRPDGRTSDRRTRGCRRLASLVLCGCAIEPWQIWLQFHAPLHGFCRVTSAANVVVDPIATTVSCRCRCSPGKPENRPGSSAMRAWGQEIASGAYTISSVNASSRWRVGHKRQGRASMTHPERSLPDRPSNPLPAVSTPCICVISTPAFFALCLATVGPAHPRSTSRTHQFLCVLIPSGLAPRTDPGPWCMQMQTKAGGYNKPVGELASRCSKQIEWMDCVKLSLHSSLDEMMHHDPH